MTRTVGYGFVIIQYNECQVKTDSQNASVRLNKILARWIEELAVSVQYSNLKGQKSEARRMSIFSSN